MSTEKPLPRWTRTASGCHNESCVVVSAYDDHVEVADSKSPGTAPLSFTNGSWRTFLDALRADRFDRP
ncbi:DUF397 domain-containing protein [Paractinoplanes toevensis]|uniref:DUF397 domain-containing protein n=1 Tax=Paractinoplanes toevensis TaxID=571911 RepID=A0A919WD44_9ACTN|nr:DUF397 domain-containing protein [Actinoplanes toevensis]GIM97937.1 hypothetical protein Ato02nite_097300 [Actinoplanes toevensis]